MRRARRLNFIDVFIRRNGVLGGVCGGVASKMGIPPWPLRIAFIISIFFSVSISFFLYFFAVLSFPNEVTHRTLGSAPRFLGVCYNWAPRLGIHESWLRFFVLVAWFFTAFIPVAVVYLIFFFIAVLTSQPGRLEEEPPPPVREVN